MKKAPLELSRKTLARRTICVFSSALLACCAGITNPSEACTSEGLRFSGMGESACPSIGRSRPGQRQRFFLHFFRSENDCRTFLQTFEQESRRSGCYFIFLASAFRVGSGEAFSRSENDWKTLPHTLHARTALVSMLFYFLASAFRESSRGAFLRKAASRTFLPQCGLSAAKGEINRPRLENAAFRVIIET